jgi:mono/diheme cytochrome c family protein
MPSSSIAQGGALARRECSSCHAVGELGRSPRPDTPPLREALDRYSPSRLELGLREGLIFGHPDMPRFKLSQGEVDALLAYLQDIQR